MFTLLLTLATGLAATASAFDCHGPYFSFYNRGGPAVSYQRLDPALFPGVESPHLHSFDGGNNIKASMDFADTQASTCTTARIKPDKSNYWRPTLFWNGNDTGFFRVPDTYLKIYYKFGDSGNVKANVSEFPQGFRMIAGNAMLRHDDSVVGTSDGPQLGWSCKGSNGNSDAIGFPSGFTSCPGGFAAQLTFPACWNGDDLDPSNPSAHMAFPTAGGLGLEACPSTHKQARFPTIFIEFWYDVSAFDGQYSSDDTPWVLANGDPTGFGFHADFINGWETGVLGKATAEEGYCNCGCGCGEDQMKECFGDENVNDDDDEDFKTCAATPEFPGDDKSPLEKLPGCNPLQSGPADATAVSGAGCYATAVSGNATSASAIYAASSAVKTTSSATSIPVSYAEPSSSAKAASSSSSAKTAVSSPYAIRSSVAAADASSITASPSSLSLSFAGKGYGTETEKSSTSTAAIESDAMRSGVLGSGSYILPSSSATAAASLSTELGDSSCGAPVFITITPTVYVTAGAGNATSCAPTVYTTITNTATVTVSAGSYKHKRHADVHQRS